MLNEKRKFEKINFFLKNASRLFKAFKALSLKKPSTQKTASKNFPNINFSSPVHQLNASDFLPKTHFFPSTYKLVVRLCRCRRVWRREKKIKARKWEKNSSRRFFSSFLFRLIMCNKHPPHIHTHTHTFTVKSLHFSRSLLFSLLCAIKRRKIECKSKGAEKKLFDKSLMYY